MVGQIRHLRIWLLSLLIASTLTLNAPVALGAGQQTGDGLLFWSTYAVLLQSQLAQRFIGSLSTDGLEALVAAEAARVSASEVGGELAEGVSTTPGSAPAETGMQTDAEKRMLELINAERVKAGMPPLVADARLVETARAKSEDMAAYNYFAHQSPRLGTPFEQMARAGVLYRSAAENLAAAGSVEAAYRALYSSLSHRANILNPNFSRIGIGIVEAGPYGFIVTQHFISE